MLKYFIATFQKVATFHKIPITTNVPPELVDFINIFNTHC